MADQAVAHSEPTEQTVQKGVSALKAMADPLRLQIMMELVETPMAVKQIAARLDVPQTRLYYHFKILEKAGLIHVTETRMVSGIEERLYRATSDNWGPGESIPALVEEGVIGAMLQVVRAELELALTSESEAVVGDPTHPVPLLSFSRWHLSPDEAQELNRRLQSLVAEFATKELTEDRRVYNALLTWYEAPDEIRKRTSDAS